MSKKHIKSSSSLLLYIFYGLIGCATLLFFSLFIGAILVFFKISNYLEKNQTRQSEYIFPNNSQFPFDEKDFFYEFDSDFFDDSFTQPFDNDSSSSDYPPINLT